LGRLTARDAKERGLAIPDSIGQVEKFRLHRRLGRDGLFETWLAEARSDGLVPQPVLLKQLVPELAADPRILSLLSLRARKASRLNHPCILRVLDVVVDSSRFALATELYDGKSLRELMIAIRAAGNALPVWFALRVVRCIASALDYAHRAVDEEGRPLCAAHRDVSPATVVVTFDGRVQVADFGMSPHALDLAGVLSPASASPGNPWAEAGTDFDALTAQDVMGVGATLYELLTGEAPGSPFAPPSQRASWVGRDVDETLSRILGVSHPQRIGTAEELGLVLDERLAKSKHEVTQNHVAGLLALLFAAECRDSGPPTVRSSAGSVPRLKVPPQTPVSRISQDAATRPPSQSNNPLPADARRTINPSPTADDVESGRSSRGFDRPSDRKLDVFRHDWDAALERVRREAPSRTSGSYAISQSRPKPPSPPKDPQVLAAELYEEGLAAMQKGDTEEALSVWERVLELDPEHRICRANLNLLRKKLGRS
jgi:eukaryotic-like serine/threonine-protein kinase